MLFCQNYDPQGKRWLLVIPQHLWQEILQNLQDEPPARHLGFLKPTQEFVIHGFFWPGVYSAVFKCVRSFQLCQRRECPTSTPPGLLEPIAPPHLPFVVVWVDLFGPFPELDNCVYRPSNMLRRNSGPSQRHSTLNCCVPAEGAPRTLIKDRGRSLLSTTVEAILSYLPLNFFLMSKRTWDEHQNDAMTLLPSHVYWKLGRTRVSLSFEAMATP